MKRTVTQICMAVNLLIGLTISAQAQMNTQHRAHIPFDFSVGGQNFRAGDYLLYLTSPASSDQVLTIREAANGEAKIFLVRPKAVRFRSETSHLVFRRYGDQFYLAEIISPTLGAEFRRTKTERELAIRQRSERETVALLK